MTTVAKTSLLDLHVPVDPEGSIAAVAPVTWSLTPELMELVESKEFRNPHLLIINRVAKKEHSRAGEYIDLVDKRAVVVPLAQAMQYFSFAAPGTNQLVAYVVDVRTPRDIKRWRNVCHEIASHGASGMTSCVDDHTLEFRESFLSNPSMPLRATGEYITVVVPAAMFAPEPPAWRKRMVAELWPRFRPIDQCEFRKRFWFFTLPFAIPIGLIFTICKLLIVGILGAAGVRGWVWAAFYPLRVPFDVFDKTSSNMHFAPLQGPDQKDRISVWTVLNLPVALAVWAIWALGSWMGWLMLLFIIMGVAATAGAIVLLSNVKTKPGYSEFVATRAATRDERERERNLAELRIMLAWASRASGPVTSIKELPPEKRTVVLYFNDFKTRVCKPFAG